MKRKVLQIGIASLIATVILGCDRKSQHVASKEMIQKSQKHFADQLNRLKESGFDINATSDSSYILTIKDPNKASIQILSSIGMTAIDQKTKRELNKILDGSKIGIDINWTRYANMDTNSTFVYFLGSKQTDKAFENIFNSKKLGAYIGFGKDDTIKTVFFKDIDEKVNKDHLQIKSLKAIAQNDSPNAFKIDAKKISMGFVQDGSTPVEVTFEKPSCDTDMQNRYLGKYSCIFPAISLNMNDSNKTLNAILDDTRIDYNAKSKNNKVSTTMNMNIKDTKLDLKNGYADTSIKLNSIKLALSSSDTNESIIKEMMRVSKEQKDLNKTNIKMAELSGKMFEHMRLDYDISLDSVNFVSKGRKNSKQIDIKAFKQKGDLSFDQTINTNDVTTLSSIKASDSPHPAPIFELKNLKSATGIRGLYNVLPEFMKIAATSSSFNNPNKEEMTDEDIKKLASLAEKMLNNGASIYYKPISVDEVSTEGKKYNKIILNLDANLTKNSINLDNPMAQLLLLQYLQAGGRLVMYKKDLESMSKSFSPTMMAMVMMYAKYDGDKAIFEVKFENGHLIINGKPLM